MDIRELNEAPFVDRRLRRLHHVDGFLRCPQCGSTAMYPERVVYRTAAQGYYARRDEAGIDRPILGELFRSGQVYPVLLLHCGADHRTEVWFAQGSMIDDVDIWGSLPGPKAGYAWTRSRPRRCWSW
jgi:hypothetical protein